MIGVVRSVPRPRGAPRTPHAAIELLRFMAPFSIDRAYSVCIFYSNMLYTVRLYPYQPHTHL